MAMPNVSGALTGWTKNKQVLIVTKSVVNNLVQQIAAVKIINMNIQPLQAWKVNRKPEEQRTWNWYSILVKVGQPQLEIDSIIIVDGIAYRIDSIQPWSESGYVRYEATEDYSGVGPIFVIYYDGNTATAGNVPEPVGYQVGASVTVPGAGSLEKTGFTFDGWNTQADGSGIFYGAGDTLTIENESLTLYAQWEEVEE
jgi:uncharacterized repeat protein (TIGR02543 family)